MRTKIVIILVVLIFELNCMNAQNVEWKTYTYSDQIRDIAEEGNFLWLATNGGLVKLNKLTGETEFFNRSNAGFFSLDVRAIAVDGNGDKWIGAYNSGLVKFDGNHSEVFSNSAINDNTNYPISIDKNNVVWFGPNLSSFDGNNWLAHGPHDYNCSAWEHIGFGNIQKIMINEEGNKWLGGGGGFAKFDGTNWTIYDKCTSEILSDDVLSFAMDSNNNFWIGTSKGLEKFDGVSFVNYFPNKSVGNVVIDTNDNIWISAYSYLEGVKLLMFDGTNWNEYEKPNPESGISKLFIDVDNLLWVAHNKKIYKFDGDIWTPFDISNSGLQSNYIRDVYCDFEGSKWIGTDEGLVVFKNNNWKVYSNIDIFKVLSPGSTYLVFNNICKDKNNNLWVTTDGKGLCKFDGNEWTIYNTDNSGLPSNEPTSILFDNFENKWITTWGGGLVKFDGVNWNVYNTDNSGIRSNILKKVAIDDKNNIWIGTLENGLSMFNGDNWINYDTTNSILTSNNVHDLLIDKKGNLWISSGKDLIKYDGENWAIFNFENIEDKSEISCLALDKLNNIWFGTYSDWSKSSGLFKFDGEKSIVYNTLNSRIASDKILSLAFDSEGVLWIGTYYDGLCTFNENLSNISKNINYSLILPNCDSSQTPLVIEEGNFSEGLTMKFPEYIIPSQYSTFQPYYNSLVNSELYFSQGSLNENIKIEFILKGLCENGLIDNPETEEIVEVLYLSFNIIWRFIRSSQSA